MYHCQEELQERQQYLDRLIEKTGENLRDLPEGSLRMSRGRGGKLWYYHVTDPSEPNGKYIPQGNRELVLQLAQKDYGKKFLKSLLQERSAIASCLKKCPKRFPEEIYDTLSEQRKELVTPIIETDEMFSERWSSVSYQGKAIEEEQKLVTERGECVRSKSELIIANLLAKEKIPYRYECPVRLRRFGVVYPDFTVLNVRMRKELYWEHMGMMDDSKYAENAVRKLRAYRANRIFQGDQLIITMETKEVPLNYREIKEIIDHYLK